MLFKKREKILKPIVKKKPNEQQDNVKKKEKVKTQQAQNALGNRAIEAKALKEKATAEKREEVVEEVNVVNTPTDPLKDKAFQGTLRHLKKSGNAQKKHEDADAKVVEVKRASHLDVAEQQKVNNQKAHQSNIENVSEKNTKKNKFTAQSFKDKLKGNLTILEAGLPHSKKGAKRFKKKKPLTNLQKGISNDVGNQKVKMVGPLETEAKKENLTKVDGAKIVKADERPKDISSAVIGVAPKPINPTASVPKPKHPSEISMEKESQSLDRTMEENNLSETQLQKSNEPTFIAALDRKKKAQEEAQKGPESYQVLESSSLKKAKRRAGAVGKQGLSSMFKSRSDNFEKVHKGQTSTQAKNINKKKEINKKFESIYNETKKDVTLKLSGITTKVDAYFKDDGKIAKAKTRFEKNVEKKLSDIYGWTTVDDTVKSFFSGRDINAGAIDKVFSSEKKLFIKTLDSAFDEIALLIATGLNEAIARIDKGKKSTDTLYKGLSSEEKKLADDSLELFNERYDALKETVNDKEKELAKSLAKKYKENVDNLKKRFDAIKKRVSAGWIEGAINAIKGVVETIKKLKALITSALSQIKAYLPVIINDPIAFLKQLFGGISAGIELFKKNIKKHVLGGFVKWLTGATSSMNITIPKNLFSLKGIFSLVMQVLGLGWDYLRKKAVKIFGEPVVKAMETSVKIFKIIRTKGVAGIWKYLKEKFNDLKTTVIEEIQSMLITQVLIAGVKWLIGLLIPGAGFIKAIIAIKDLIVSLVQSALALIPAFIAAIKALASGNLKGVAKAVEKGLGLIIVIVINLFAKLIGLGGLAKKVMKIIERVRKRIDKAIDKLLDRAKKSFKGLFKKGKGKTNSKKGKIDKTLGEKLTFRAGKENHNLWITNKGGKVNVMVASENPGPVAKLLNKWEKTLATLEVKNQEKAKKSISNARRLSLKTMSEAKEEALITKAILKDKDVTLDEAKKENKAEKETIEQEKKLKGELEILFDVFGESSSLEEKINEMAQKAIHGIIVNDTHKKIWDKYRINKEKDEKYTKGYTKDDFLKYRKHQIKKRVSSLLAQYRNDEKEEPLIKALEKYFLESLEKKGTAEHTDYKPVIKSIKKRNNKFSIEYSYESVEHKKKSFEVNFDFSKIDDDKSSEVTQTTLGKNLTLKESGTRGKTKSSGELMNKTILYKQFLNDKKIAIDKDHTEEILKKKVDALVDEKGLVKHFKEKAIAKNLKTVDSNLFDSAHLVADWFSGSGYRDALNLVLTSAEYNRQTMGGAEKNIVTTLKDVDEDPLFNLWVAATWDTLKDSEITEDVTPISIVKQLNQNSKIKNEDTPVLAKQATKELSKVLLAKKDPKRVLSVLYNGKTINREISKDKKKFKEKIGCDIWMSSYFDFDKDRRCD